ncbi:MULTISPECIES: carbohydrate kinase [unclassified Gilliamella]|uniref:carbohydrate kinase family protein n=1 Tax=unclassified Gilliamella TaxID=2685620 RepID=UPI000A332414|nr:MULTISPECIES: carbohydrate kinase [unclassified Gilliamella]OTQ71659.1 hypothetical protein B6C99_11980 [Gilliamella sp. N-G2]OTQ77452.1 hypothetical protein B6D23_11615 [Gilliamella sp. N-W3]
MNDIKIVAIGEFLWDCLPNGKKIGGAAANFCYHAKSAGANAILVSAIGDDDNGRELREQIEKLRIPQQIQISANYPTGTVLVKLDSAGKPTYNIVNPVAWDDIQLTDQLLELIQQDDLDAIYFGSLIQRNIHNHELLQKIINHRSQKSKIIVDINLRQNHYNHATLLLCIEHANILKLNDEELPIVADLLKIKADPQALFNYLNQHYQLELLIYTCGSEGSHLITQNEQNHCPAEKITPIDTVGAGDSFMAISSVLYLKGKQLQEINSKANHIAAYVCTQSGPMPILPQAYIAEL